MASGRFPIVVLEPGMGLSAPQFTSLAEEIASHGYLVAGVTPTFSANVTVLAGKVVTASAAGNPSELGSHGAVASALADRVLAVWTADARFARAKVAAWTAWHRSPVMWPPVARPTWGTRSVVRPHCKPATTTPRVPGPWISMAPSSARSFAGVCPGRS